MSENPPPALPSATPQSENPTTIRGLRVWDAKEANGYWCREQGNIGELPGGWQLLPKGDARLTREVRRGPHWIYLKKKGIKKTHQAYTVELGTPAPRENIMRAFNALGGIEGAEKRASAKKETVANMEQRLTEQLKAAIRCLYLGIPKNDLEAVLDQARSGGRVGNAPWLYFCGKEEREAAFNTAADLAVRAHVRHQHTDYDERLNDLELGHVDGELKRQIREEVAGRIESKLAQWRGDEETG